MPAVPHPVTRPVCLARVAVGLLALAVALALAPASLAAKTPTKTKTTTKPTTTSTNSAGPLLWTAPARVDATPIDAMACPTASECVAVDRSGGVLWSADPAGGAREWALADVDGATELTGISCPSTTLCVAVDAAGNAVTSLDPTGGPTAWTVAHIDTSTTENDTDTGGAVLLRSVSCPSTTLCVAVDAAGNAIVSIDPTGGTAAWRPIHIDDNIIYHCTSSGLTCQPPLVDVSCPSMARCVAVDFSGNVLSSNNPTVAAPWPSASTDPGRLSSLWSVSCPLTTFCATVDGTVGRAITFNPATPAKQAFHSLSDSLYGIWCQSRSLCLASVQTSGGISGLLGSFDPAAKSPTWSLSTLGGVDAVSCPGAGSLCLAADDEGNIAAGETTTGIVSGLRNAFLAARRQPTIAALDRKHRATFTYTSHIAARVTLAWTVAGRGAEPVSIATASHRFSTPGTAKLTLRLTAAGRGLFAAATGPTRVTSTATFLASTGSVSAVAQLTLRHPPKR